MDGYSGLRTLRSPRRLTVIGGVAAVALTTFSAAGATTADRAAPAATRLASATATQSFTSAPHTWDPSGNARVRTVSAAGVRSAKVVPKHRSGRKNISIQSSPTLRVVSRAGSTVTATARLRTSQAGRRLYLRVMEVAGGRVVASRSVSVRPGGRDWRTLDVSLRTTTAGSRLVLQAKAKRVSKRNFLRVSPVTVRVTAPASEPTDPPTDPPGDPTPVGTCEEIDYSDPAQGSLTFADEFNGTAIDRSTWRVRDNTFLNQDGAWITKDAVSVHDGYLDIAGKRLPESQFKSNPQANYPGENTVRKYSTGYVDTIDDAGYGNASGNRFGQKYGHFEVRAWVPSASTMSRGIWPAFWLRADHKRGEIDPLESYGAPTIRNYDPSSSYEWNSWHDTLQEWSKDHTQGTADVGTDKIWQGWHTYGVNWSPGCLRYLYDGRTVGLVDFKSPTTKAYFLGDTFDDTFHIRLNLQVGTKYWGWADPQHTRDSFNYKVDWVRVYQGKELLAGR